MAVNKILWITFLSTIVCAVISCNNSQTKKFNDPAVQHGYELAQMNCKTCHKLPTPDLLNKATWADYVLPKMGELVGFRSLGMNHYVENGKVSNLKLEDWNNIVAYFTSQAPEQLKKSDAKKIRMGLSLFNVEAPLFGLPKPATTMAHASFSKKGFYFGDALSQQLYFIASNNSVDSFAIGKGISNLRVSAESYDVLSMGVLYPSDSKEGKLVSINSKTKNVTLLLDSLQRPVDATYADLNNDKTEDIIICEFGNQTGALCWYEHTGANTYNKHILRALPGAIKTAVYDFNKDGRPDIMALMAQGDEGIFIYYNMGSNSFKEERVLQLPPSYGSNYFELADLNNDGFMDIIASNGDNGDYPPVLKPYHGIRLYLNDGKNHFTEKAFMQVNGIGKVIARDFDNDGDIDMASIAFFPDYEHSPEEGFIYWENKGNLSFEASSFKEVNSGRWITMDAGDIDGDGDIDLVLGNANFFIGAVSSKMKERLDAYSPSVIILKNKLH